MSSTPGRGPASGRTGRRPGPNRTRAAILDAARSAFASIGYDAVSLRAVARRANVDAALVHRFFESKERLFVEALQLPYAPSQLVPAILAPGPDGLGERIVETLLALNDEGATPFAALLRAAVSNEQAAAMLREFLTTEVLGRIAAAAAPDQPELRATLAGSQIIGVAMARYIIRLPHAVAIDRSYLAACIGPTIQRYLTDVLPVPAAPPRGGSPDT